MMYRPKAYVVDDVAMLHLAIRTRAFATLACVEDGRVRLGYAPVVLDDDGGLGRIRFHLAKANPMAAILAGARLTVSFMAADAYVSPDWYAGEGFVPTWNYVAVEGEGRAEALDAAGLERLVAELSAQEEARLAPKPLWTMDKLATERREALLRAIDGFAVPFARLEGKFKLSQEKGAADRAGVIAALEARDDAGSLAIAKAMRSS